MPKLRDIMSTDLATVSPRTTLRDAAALLTQRHVSGMPVLRNGGIVGMISASDILLFAGSAGDTDAELLALVGEQVSEGGVAAPGPLDGHTVEEAMTRKLWALDSDADVTLAAQLMTRNGIHRVIVTANGKLAGIVSTSDIARAFADGQA
jgi:CBS domain-containing protein